MSTLDVQHLESEVAQAAAQYCAVVRAQPIDGLIDAAAPDHKAGQALGAALSFWLQAQLERDDTWRARRGWLDGALIYEHQLDGDNLTLAGAVYIVERGVTRLAPFRACLRIDKNGTRLASHELRFGDRLRRGIDPERFNWDKHNYLPENADDWYYTFRG